MMVLYIVCRWPHGIVQYNRHDFKKSTSTPRANSLRPRDTYMRQWSNNHWFRQWLVAWSEPTHYLNHFWNIINWSLKNKLQLNFKQNSNIFIQEKCIWKCRLRNSGNFVSKFLVPLSGPQQIIPQDQQPSNVCHKMLSSFSQLPWSAVWSNGSLASELSRPTVWLWAYKIVINRWCMYCAMQSHCRYSLIKTTLVAWLWWRCHVCDDEVRVIKDPW